jgi:hypothetical protein
VPCAGGAQPGIGDGGHEQGEGHAQGEEGSGRGRELTTGSTNGSNRSSSDPNEDRERLGERRKREGVVTLLLVPGCAGKGSGGGACMEGARAVRRALGPGRGGTASPLLDLACSLIKFIPRIENPN